MELINILIIVSAVVLLLVLWAIVGIRHLKNLKERIRDEWEVVSERLRKRHDLLPNLIETVRKFAPNQEELLQEAIDERSFATREYGVNAKKIEYELFLSKKIDKIFDLGKSYKELSKDTNFLSLRKEIDDLERNIEEKTNVFNGMVRYYNRHRRNIFLLPLAAVWGFKTENIFEVEI